MAIYFVVCNVDFGASTTQAVTRTVEIGQMLDEQSVLNEYEDVTVQTEGLKTEFTGYRSIDPSLFDEIDNVNQSDEKQSECRVLYRYSYDMATNIVTIYAEMNNEYGEIVVDTLYGLAFTNGNGEIDAIISLDDGDSIYLSDLMASKIDNVGWLSRLVKKVAAAIVVRAVNSTKVVAAVAAATVATVVAKVIVEPIVPSAKKVIDDVVDAAKTTVQAISAACTEKSQAMKNYEHNKKLNQAKLYKKINRKLVDEYIHDQDLCSEWKYGTDKIDTKLLNKIAGRELKNTLDNNGCGIIATYNALRFLHNNKRISSMPSLAQIIYEIERNSGTLALGYFGTDPYHPLEYFASKGIRRKQYVTSSQYEKAMRNMSPNQCAMVCYWNEKYNVTAGAHFVMFTKNEQNNYRVYNGDDETATTLSQILGKGEGAYITGYIVG